MTTRTRVALAGCGRIARQFHLPLLAGRADTRVVAVADAEAGNREAALAALPEHGAIAVADWRDAVALPGVDALVVCLPTALHADAAVAALEAGLHVYVEKPLAADVADARRVAAAWEATGRIGVVGFNFRAHPLARELRAQVAAGRLGRLVGVRTAFASSPRALPDWKQRRATGGGALLDLASHHVDLLRFLLDEEVAGVRAALRSVRSEDDTAALTCRLSGGALAQVFVSISAAQQDRVEVIGEHGTLAWDRMRRRRLAWTPSRGPASRAERLAEAGRVLAEGARATVDGLRPPPEPSFAAALGDFVAAVRSGRAGSTPTIADGLRSLEVLDAAERAARTGAEVPLDAGARAGA